MEKEPSRDKAGIQHDVAVYTKEVVVSAEIGGSDVEGATCYVFEKEGKQYLKAVINRENSVDGFVAEIPVAVENGIAGLDAVLEDGRLEVRIKRIPPSIESIPQINQEDTLNPEGKFDPAEKSYFFDWDLHVLLPKTVNLEFDKDVTTGRDMVKVEILTDDGQIVRKTIQFSKPIDTKKATKSLINGQLDMVFPVKE